MRIASTLALGAILLLPSPLAGQGLPRRGMLGAGFGPVTPAAAEANDVGAGDAIQITLILPGLTADRAHLRVGDLLLSINGQAARVATFAETVRQIPAGSEVRLDVLRDGKRLTLRAPLAEKPRDPGNTHYVVAYSDVLSQGHRFRTIISHPRDPGRHPALFFIPGYTPISYDYNLSSSGPDAPILFDFADRGFVTVRVEKPGVGDSEGGPYSQVDFPAELDIYRQALAQLRSLADVDTTRAFIFGHSMGGAFGPILATETSVRGLVMYGVVARTWHEYLLDVVRYQALLGGASYAEADERVRQAARIHGLILGEGESPEQVSQEHPDLRAAVEETFPDGMFNEKIPLFWRQLAQTNFASYWSRVNTHVLAVHGASDFVTYAVDHQLVADIVNAGHPGWGRFATAANSDHLLNDWPTEAESLKHYPAGTFNPAFLTIMKAWVDEVLEDRG